MTQNKSNNMVYLTWKELLIIILSLQLALLGLVGLDVLLGLGIPIIGQIIVFVNLTFVPGFLILKILKVTPETATESLLYSVGLSLSFLMFIGGLINFLYPLIGIANPISKVPLAITISSLIILLCLICYLRNKDDLEHLSINIQGTFSVFAFSSILLPFLAVFGTYTLNFYDNNTLLLILLGAISLIPVIVGFHKLHKHMYPLVIWVISISLLLHTSLVSPFVSDFGDAAASFYHSYLIVLNGYWDLAYPEPINSMLSVKMLPPIYSLTSGLDLIWTYKMIYPLLYSFMPLVTYSVYRKQKIPNEVAFLSSCYIMFIFPFFTIFQANIRTGIAELFLVLLVLTMVSKDIVHQKRTILATIFGISIIVSHYGVSYLALTVFFFALPILLWYKKHRRCDSSAGRRILSFNFLGLYGTALLSWYMYTSASAPFEILPNFLRSFPHQLSQLLYISISQLGFDIDLPLSIVITRDLILASFLFIGISLMILIQQIIKRNNIEFDHEYAALSIAFFVVLVSVFTTTQNFALTRGGHICLIFLAPFCILGITKILHMFGKILNVNIKDKNLTLKIFSLFLLMMLLFGSGFISETIIRNGDFAPSKLILKPRWTSINDPWFVYEFYRGYFFENEVLSAEWLAKNGESTNKIYADGGRFVLGAGPLRLFMPETRFSPLTSNVSIEEDAYIYLRYLNVVEGKMIEKEEPLTIRSTESIYHVLTSKDKIYTNGGSAIYYAHNT